jgi:carboxypeptidase Taq
MSKMPRTPKASTARRIAAESSPRPRNRQTFETKLAELKRCLLEISDLSAAGAVLNWDQNTYMPPGGADARSRQRATLSRLAHEKSVDPALGRLLDALEPNAEGLPYDSDDASLIRVARRDFERATKVPADFVARATVLASASYNAWTRARPANDFAAMQPFLEQTIDLSRAYADFFAPYQHIADPLIDEADPGMTTGLVRTLFAQLRDELLPTVRTIADQPPADDACLRGPFGEREQLDFGLSVVKQFGYDLDRGRLDKTRHPFCAKFSAGDVRITTRIRVDDLGDALFSILHEAGHALYEQGVSSALEGTTLGCGTSAGVHESQSRLWENVVGRGYGFWQYHYPVLQRLFPDRLGKVPLDTFYRAINRVRQSLIRTDADEVTYNLHVMMRFELELDMLEGRLRVKDLPEAWRARMQTDFGVVPPDDRDGCLQDVHWYSGAVGGGFQGYTIGNILSAQFYAAAIKAHPEIPEEIASGEFSTLHAWLRTHLYQHGRKFEPNEIVERATGNTVTIAPYLRYLREKYGALYELPGAIQH